MEKRFPDTNMHGRATPSQKEVIFNSPDMGDLKGGVAPFFNTLLML